MKIGFTGAGGTGKTTTLNILSEMYPDIPVLPSNTRSVYNKWNITEVDQETMTFQDKLRLQEDIYAVRVEAENKCDRGFLSDRTILDNFCYQQVRCYEAMDHPMFMEKRKLIKENMRQYDFICYFPITFAPVGDDVRYGNPVFQNLMDNLMFAELHKLDLWKKVLTVGAGSPEDRAHKIMKLVETLSEPPFQHRLMLGS